MSCKVFLVILGSCFIAALAISVNYDNADAEGAVGNREWNFDTEELDLEEEEEDGHRRGKILFPFVSIVRFANTECATATTMTGTCLARRECNNLNGTITGTCASRRGRCCVVARGCSSTTNVNNTYFTSPGYPAAYSGGAACSIIVNRCNSNICQDLMKDPEEIN